MAAVMLFRASVNILQSGVRTSVVLNLDIRYAPAIKSDVTLDAGRKRKQFSAFARSWDRMSSVCPSVRLSVCNVGDL